MYRQLVHTIVGEYIYIYIYFPRLSGAPSPYLNRALAGVCVCVCGPSSAFLLSSLHDIIIEAGNGPHAGVCIVDHNLFRGLVDDDWR